MSEPGCLERLHQPGALEMAGGDMAGAGGDSGEGRAPPASWDPEKSPEGKQGFFPRGKQSPDAETRKPRLLGQRQRSSRAACDTGKLYSQRSCSNEKMNQTSYGVDIVLKCEE